MVLGIEEDTERRAGLMLGLPALFYVVDMSAVPLLVVAVIRGIGFGAVTVAEAALIAELVPPRMMGNSSAALGVSVGLSQLLSFPLGLWLLNAHGEAVVFVTAAVYASVGAAAAYWIPYRSRAQLQQARRSQAAPSISDATSAGFGLSHTEQVSTLSDIAEIAAGDYEMRNDEDAHEAYHRVLFRWLHGELEVPVDGAKNGAEILSAYIAQIMSVLNALPESTDVAVVSHGAIIRFWTYQRADNIKDSDLHAQPLPNTGIVVLEGDSDSGWTVVSWLGTALAGTGPDDPDPYDGPTGHPFED